MSTSEFLKGERTLNPVRLLRRIGMHGVTMLTVLVMLGSIVMVQGAIAQDAGQSTQTPDVTLPGDDDEADSTPAGTPTSDEGDNAAPDDITPTSDEDTEESSGPSGDSALEPGHPAVVSQGLAFLEGGQAVWQVREMTLSDAQTETGGAAHVLQRDGETIVRNDVTAKRTLLEPGEGFFRAGDDPYTFAAQGGDSTLWMFELVAEDAVADDAFYKSPLIDRYDEGTYDAELIRFEVEPGDEFELPEHTGPALLMVTSGEINVEDENGLYLLSDGLGQLFAETGSVSNSGSEAASFVFATFGASVGEGTDAATDEEGADGTPEAAEDDDPAGDAADTGAAEAQEDAGAEEDATDTTVEEEAAEDAASDEPAATGDSGFTTTINVTAQVDLTLTIVADGVTVFDGPLPAGSSSGPVAGATFQVTTSSGVNTLFTNACGDQFTMGAEEGTATYDLAADASSCAP